MKRFGGMKKTGVFFFAGGREAIVESVVCPHPAAGL